MNPRRLGTLPLSTQCRHGTGHAEDVHPAMKRRSSELIAVLGALALGLASGCGISPPEPPPLRAPSTYHEPTAPESLVANLEISYRRRESQEYARILAPEFRFKLQPIDAAEFEKVFLTHAEDSTGTGHLLTAPDVSGIRIDLLDGSAEPANEIGMPAGARRIHITKTGLELDVNHVTFVVTGQQDMFFRHGLAEAGEDTTRWFLFEWRDLPSQTRPELGSFEDTGGGTPVRTTTWGSLKTVYWNSLSPSGFPASSGYSR